MKKEHFEILLEKIEGNFQLAFEKFDLVDDRLDRLETGHARLETGQERLEAGQQAIKVDVRDIKRTVGLLHSIANDHENRLQNVEVALRDHLDNHDG